RIPQRPNAIGLPFCATSHPGPGWEVRREGIPRPGAQLMPSLAGMKGGGYYDRHSTVQSATLDAFADWVVEPIGRMALPDEPSPIAVADYGCSEGANSIRAAGVAVEALRRRRAEQPIVVIHSDLPSNNFNRLFANLHDPSASNYLQERGVL